MQIWVELGSKSIPVSADPLLSINKLGKLAIDKLFADQAVKPDFQDYEVYYRKKKLNGLSSIKGNIPDGSQVQLQREPCGNVDVALIVEDTRIITKLTAKATLWELLLNAGDSKQQNFIRRSSNDRYLMPVLVYLNKQIDNIHDLQTITLASLGVKSGSGAFRLKFKEMDFGIEKVSSLIERFQLKKTTIPIEIAKDSSKFKTEPAPTVPADVPMDQPVPALVEKAPAFAANEKFFKPPPAKSFNHSIIYLTVNLPDSFFELSSAELQRILNAKSTIDDKPLMTQKLRDQEQNLRELKYPKTMIRVKFANEYVFQSTYFSGDSVDLLYDAVRAVVDTEDFELYTSPPKKIIKKGQSFTNAKLAPATMVYISSGNLKQTFIDTAIDFPLPSQLENTQPPSLELDEIQVGNSDLTPKPSPIPPQEKPSKKGVPKWLKL